MKKPAFATVLTRIRAHEGETFQTFTGLPFSYWVDGDYFEHSRTDYRVHLSNLEKAYELSPCDGGPAPWKDAIRAYTYIWRYCMIPEFASKTGKSFVTECWFTPTRD